ncbi:MAG: CRR6 family NdhI maturation factor [Okeania sp. SIO3I5]|uniref:CRR6 family NdhI maturation factor n=1 Tax=Okeania sp. SIO3I5 TaxID=2607805 RepID=UPI0013B68C00|nr:CRR6 family NdhI maturation factor [Okeania sp. SIO3I5]NEQ34831.1 CRR6 family NdhI maturation factor [Okeania sp. SIO3I5]
MKIALNTEHIHKLDLSPVESVISPMLKEGAIASSEQQLNFTINYQQDPQDPRELSEIPEVRLWFICLDSRYPWLPFLLNWKEGELSRYTAMLVPHQFHRSEGIQYNPEALEIFLMHKIFVLKDWLNKQNISSKSRLMSMSQMLGYDLAEEFLE